MPESFALLVGAALLTIAVLGTGIGAWMVRGHLHRAAAARAWRTELDDVHTAATGVPASNATLGHDPRTGHLRIRRRRRRPRELPAAPRERADRKQTHPLREQRGPSASESGREVTRSAEPAGAARRLPGSRTSGDENLGLKHLRRLAGEPDTGAEDYDEVARRWPALAGPAAVLAVCVEENPHYRRHLETAVAHAATLAGSLEMPDLRAARRVPVPLPHHFATAYLPCTADGLWVADLTLRTLSGRGEPGEDELAFLTVISPSPVLATLQAHLARSNVSPLSVPAASASATRTQWDLIAAHDELLTACLCGDGDVNGHAGQRLDALLDADLPASEDLRVDVEALRHSALLMRASSAAGRGNLTHAEDLISRAGSSPQADALRWRLRQRHRGAGAHPDTGDGPTA